MRRDARSGARAAARRKVGVGAVRQVRRATAEEPSTKRSSGRPPPNGSAAGRSRLKQSASIDRTDPAGAVGIEAGVVRGDIDLAAGERRRSIAPDGMVEAAGRVAIRVAVGEAVERPPRSRAAVGTGFTHPLDLPDLHCRRAARVRHDAVFGLGMGE